MSPSTPTTTNNSKRLRVFRTRNVQRRNQGTTQSTRVSFKTPLCTPEPRQSNKERSRRTSTSDSPEQGKTLEQEADYLALVPRTVFSPTASTVTETTFSTGPPYHLATTAPGIGLPQPPPPPPPTPSKQTCPQLLPGLNPTLGHPHAPFLAPIPETYIPPPPVVPTATVPQPTAAPGPAPNPEAATEGNSANAPVEEGNQIPITLPNPTGL